MLVIWAYRYWLAVWAGYVIMSIIILIVMTKHDQKRHKIARAIYAPCKADWVACQHEYRFCIDNNIKKLK